ncbi:hypothetical protein HZH68_002400 [Vespula germanica]|uniref:Uncharacterized protein n=1 Tax=Vespula germanica TaxID=30212 RepID=A0A834NM88_VESGE|nr:hypothetical protein HZH68_002400 [Vespula germanica]
MSSMRGQQFWKGTRRPRTDERRQEVAGGKCSCSSRRMSATPRDPLRISNTSVPVTGQFQSVPPWYSVYVTIYSAYDPTIPRIVPPC